jgi:lipopolysaccharide/colanic/teichoic acid biosynthesis glycosyltransferase
VVIVRHSPAGGISSVPPFLVGVVAHRCDYGEEFLAEEAAPASAVIDNDSVRGDTGETERMRSQPSITDVAMQFASDIVNRTDDDVSIDLATDDHIVIDLRSTPVHDYTDTTVELHVIRELPPILDINALEPFTGHRADRSAFFEEDDASRPSGTDLSELGTTLRTAVSPVGGLATASWPARAAKRTVDIIVSALALLLLTPLLLAVTVLVKATSRGPVLYRSVRTGKDGREFAFWKFRSMYVGAADHLTLIADENEQTGPVFKMKHDPRITKFGRILRKTSIDELPQLLHVLTGKMSLVGPRPALPAEVAQYDARARQRLAVKPGITCIWQVSGRSDIDFDTWVDMDVEYIKKWSPLLDIRLLLLTIPAVISGKGAY